MASTSAEISSEFEQNSGNQDLDDSGDFPPTDPDEFIDAMQTDVSRWIEGVRKTKKLGERDGLKLAPLEKSLNEVQLVLRHMKQNIEIPEVILEHDPNVQQVVDEARKEGRKPNAGNNNDA